MYCIYLAQSFTTSLNIDLRQDINKQRFKEFTRFFNGTFPWEENVHALQTFQFFCFLKIQNHTFN